MQGKILDYSNDMKSGFLRDEGENRYHFFRGDCTNPEELKMGADVTFEHDGEKAIEITVIERVRDNSVSEKEGIQAASAKKSKKMISILLIAMLIFAIGGLIVIQRISEIQDQKFLEIEKKYELQIKSIKKYLIEGECSKATSAYIQAGDTRREIYKHGAYYSIETHSQHAHAIDIAECFTNKKDFKDAVKMLDIENSNTPDYFNRASIVYKKAGDTERAQEAHLKAQEFLP